MNWWLKGNARKQVAPLAAQEPSGYWDRVGAGYQLSRIEDNSWNRAEVTERAYYADLAEQMSSQVPTLKDRPAPYKLAEWNSLPQVRKRLAVQAQAMVAQNPELRGHFPTTTEELEAGALEYRRKEAQEAMATLSAAPNDAFFAETLGRLAAGATDPVTLASIPVSMVAGPQAGLAVTVGAGAAINAGSELLIAPRRIETAKELDLPEPNIALDVGVAALTGGVLDGGAKIIGDLLPGAARARAYRQERGLATDASAPEDVSAGRYEADVSGAESALLGGKALPQVGRDAPPNWEAIRGGIFAGESGGDYDALFRFSNRQGGPFQNVKLTEMSVDQAIDFSAPSGKYAGWVRGQIGRTATPMGAYQIVGTTLRDAKRALGLTGDEVMTPELQDRLGQWILKTQGTRAWEGYRGPRADFTPDTSAPYGGRDPNVYVPTSRGYTGRGQVAVGDRRIDVDYEVVDAASLHRASGRFQPRDRGRINSDAWISDTAARLDPAQLMPSPTADRGAPIVGPDNMIESGNGRFGAIERAYAQHPDRAAAYRQQIEAAGFTVPEGVERPVLIARRRTELDDAARERLTVDAQDAGVARMTPTEIARTSSRAMTADRLATYRPGAGITDPENSGFLQSVLGALSRSERNALFDDAGALNAEGKRRMSQAFFARAWDDGGALGRDVLTRYAELEDAGELKTLMTALEDAAPSWATMRAEIEAGQVRPEFDITPHVLDALHVITMARRDAGRMGGTITDAIEAILSQGDMFQSLNPLSVALLRKFWRDGRAAPAADIASFLRRYADEARTAGRTGDMMGASPADVLRRLDGKAFDDLPDDIPPIDTPEPEPVRDTPMAEQAYADGAQSPEAEQADSALREELAEGPFGPVYPEFAGKPREAIAHLLKEKTGEVPDAITRSDLGGISFIYGNEKFGLRHIEAKHPEMIERLPDLLENATLAGRLSDRAYLQLSGDPTPTAVIRLTWNGEERTWLVTAFDDEREQVARQLRTSDEPAASASSRIPDATGQTQHSASRTDFQSDDDITRALSEFREQADFELPDGRRASDVLREIDDNDTLDLVLDTCMLGGKA